MKQWRDRGYVAGSDDEELGLESDESQVVNEDVVTHSNEQPDQPEQYSKLSQHGIAGLSGRGPSDLVTKDEKVEIPSPKELEHEESSDDDILVDDSDIDETIVNTSKQKRQDQQLVSEEDEDELQQPGRGGTLLQAVRTTKPARTIAPDRSGKDIFDIPSSPLSEAPSDFSDTGKEIAPVALPVAARVNPPLSSGPSIRNPPSPQDISSILSIPDPDHRSIAGRIFRRRAPIQLHPYLLEQEHYKQSLKARGLRPVAIVSSPHAPGVETQDPESQFQDDSGMAQSQMNLASSSPVQPSWDDEQNLPEVAQPGLDYDSDNLPDIATILDKNNVTAERRGLKRRKVMQTYSRGSGRQTYPSLLTARAERSPERHTVHNPVSDLLSPPLSAGAKKTPEVVPSKRRKRTKKFRVPRGMVPIQLPTPDASSQTPRTTTNFPLFPELSDSDPEDELPRAFPGLRHRSLTRSLSGVAPVSLDSADESASETEALKKATHRLKGVLPASWLRLDHQTQVRRRRESTVESPVRTQQRGVAQRVKRTQQSTPTPATVFEISDDLGSPPLLDEDGPVNSERNAYDVLRHATDDLAEDVIEEDYIDSMLPTISRNRTKCSGSRKQQPSIINALKGHSKAPTRHTNTGSTLRTGSSRPNHARPAKRKSAPRLGILDSRTLPSKDKQPDFLNIATRQARSRADKARHSPGIKVFQMQDRHNAMDVMSVLADWRAGRIAKERTDAVRTAPTIATMPLKELSYNQQKFPSARRVTSSTLKDLLARPTRPRSTTGGRPRQTRLAFETQEPLTEESPIAPPRSVHRNVTTAPSRPAANKAFPGQLEELRRERPRVKHRSVLGQGLRNLHALDRAEQALRQTPNNVMLARFMEQESPAESSADIPASIEPRQEAVAKPLPIRRRRRKRTPQRLDLVEADIDVPDDGHTSVRSLIAPATSTVVPHTLEGLGPFGTYYTPDFDIVVLPVGTYFSSTTFIGSCEFQTALQTSSRDLDSTSLRSTSFELNGQEVKLGAWTETASTSLSSYLTTCLSHDGGERSIAMCIRQIVAYVATSLYFLDSPDRDSFLLYLISKIKWLIAEIELVHASRLSPGSAILQVRTYLTVLAGQAYMISTPPIVDVKLKIELEALIKRLVKTTSQSLFVAGSSPLKEFHARTHTSSFLESGIGGEDVEVEYVVVTHRLLRRLGIAGLDFTTFVNAVSLRCDLSRCTRVSVFDRTWHDILSILPLLAIDETGFLTAADHAANELGTIEAVESILSGVFMLYQKHLCELSRPINPYIRASLARFFVMIRKWGWRRCESALSTVFDFFARNGFALLKNEDGIDTVKFLKELDKRSIPILEAGDRSFDIFLKALFVGLHGLQECLPEKKIRNIAWRFIPNHGRQHEKDCSLTPADVQALRNTHDLLSVLYAASPAGYRPNLDLIRNLVDFSRSHAEVCKLNVRTWANLVRFQLSTDESMEALEPFIKWYSDMLGKLLQQYQQARLEAQAHLSEGAHISDTLVEMTIAQNQMQVANMLILCLTAASEVIQHARRDDSALNLFRNLPVPDVLALFGSVDSRLNNLLIAGLETYEVTYKRLRQSTPAKGVAIESSAVNDDSQDFGDFPDLDDLEDITIIADSHTTDENELVNPVQQLLSNCFGTESGVDDRLLTKVVDVWVQACDILVHRQHKAWAYFLDPQSSGSWNQLRHTDSKRKYFPYFMAAVVDCAPELLETDGQIIISSWLISLVERESMMKYQHRLTSLILNVDSNHPLLANAPFTRDRASSKYTITLSELMQRRIALLSNVLANMRTSFEASFINSTSDFQQLRHEYQDLLKIMMGAMKKNYQEIQQGASVKGAYVEFVQAVIGEMQQYVGDICPIDKFFTDSAVFPLPATDPTYVVGRLRGYGLKANDPGEQKKLAIFFQAVCERAAIDNQQSYLIQQLEQAVGTTRERGVIPKQTLRGLLLSGIFPAYMKAMFVSPCGWILAIPVLEALTHILEAMFSCFSLSDEHSTRAVTDMLTTVLISLRDAVTPLVDDSSLLSQPCFLATLSLVYSVVKVSASLVDYIHRFSQSASTAVECIRFLNRFGQYVTSRVQDGDEIDEAPLFEYHIDHTSGSQYAGIRTFCRDELTNTMRNNWSKHEGEYYVVRGASTRQVMLEVGGIEEESRGLVISIGQCMEAQSRMPTFHHGRLWRALEVRSKPMDVMI